MVRLGFCVPLSCQGISGKWEASRLWAYRKSTCSDPRPDRVKGPSGYR